MGPRHSARAQAGVVPSEVACVRKGAWLTVLGIKAGSAGHMGRATAHAGDCTLPGGAKLLQPWVDPAPAGSAPGSSAPHACSTSQRLCHPGLVGAAPPEAAAAASSWTASRRAWMWGAWQRGCAVQCRSRRPPMGVQVWSSSHSRLPRSPPSSLLRSTSSWLRSRGREGQRGSEQERRTMQAAKLAR